MATDKYRAKSISKKEQRIMISVHYYDPWDFCGGENGVITQWGKEATDPQSEFYRAYFARKLCEVSKETGCIPMYWDNGYNGVHGFGLFDRTTNKITQPAIIDGIMEGSGRKVKKNTEMMSVRLYASDSYYWYTVQSDNVARITKKGGTYTLKLRGNKEMLSNITTISLRDCYVEQGKFTMELINQWSEAEPMITALQKKDSFAFEESQYQEENVLEVTFTVSNLS